MIRFSVITIVRNDPVGVVRTLQSVFAQTWPRYELIVQDGASTDETSDILRSFGDWIDSLTVERDGGIYDAMNRALARATGDYLLFLNAADAFADAGVLERVAAVIDPAADDILAGQAIADETGKVHRFRPPDQFWVGSTFDHQAAFIRRDLMQRLGYDTRYKITADQHFFTRARQEGARFRHIDLPVARKPFAIGASSDFADRVRDRLDMLEAAWGDQYPVRETIRRELVAQTARAFDLDPALIADRSVEDILALREGWTARLP
ncbi:MAG: glycosyltransferase family 2 protein [Gemmobacter sp.]